MNFIITLLQVYDGVLFGITFKTICNGLFQRMLFKEDNWHVTWALGIGNINFQFYTDDVPGW